ncbi:hypothetical protein Tco_0497233 [Tanacetum coccineum]
MKKAVLKQQLKHLHISKFRRVRKGGDMIVSKILSWLEGHGDKVSTEDAIIVFLFFPQLGQICNDYKNQTRNYKFLLDHLPVLKMLLLFTQHRAALNKEREVPAGFADEVIYSLFAKQIQDFGPTSGIRANRLIVRRPILHIQDCGHLLETMDYNGGENGFEVSRIFPIINAQLPILRKLINEDIKENLKFKVRIEETSAVDQESGLAESRESLRTSE